MPIESVHSRSLFWLKEIAFPFWTEWGFDAQQLAFHERLSQDGSPDRRVPRRVRVQARQIYVFSHAAVRGIYPQGADLALRAFERLLATAYRPDGLPGYVHLLTPDGGVADARRDSTDHLFLVLALAWLARATGDAQVRARLEALLDYIDEAFTLPDGSLRTEAGRDDLPRLQLPHMHGFEAMLALHAALAHPKALPRAAQLRRIFEQRFYDAGSATLIERLQPDGSRPEHWQQEDIAPGLQAEWCWMLRRHEQLTGMAPDLRATRMFEVARRSADAHGLLVDAADRLGRARTAARRSWPQTELVKGWVGEHEAGHPHARIAGEAALAALFSQYLDKPSKGLWVDQINSSAQVVTGSVSASTFYHLFVAITEAARVWA